jgi:signal transduction histidine kinase
MRLNLHPHLPLMEADPAQIQQVVMNLVINASEAMGEQNGVITRSTWPVDVSPASFETIQEGQPVRPGPHVGLEVSDNGCGMAGFLQKPFALGTLVEMAQQLLARQQQAG